MSSTRRHTHLLDCGLTVVLLVLGAGVRAATVRAMLAAELYVLCGATRTASGADGGYGGYGAYVGQSAALRARTLRVGVSLRTWTYRLGRLTPDTVLLIRGTDGPIDEQSRLLVESALARAISGDGYTILNTRTASPTAAARASRQQRLWAIDAADDLHDLLRRRVLSAHAPAATGGSTREQLIRLVLAHGPMDVRGLLSAAREAGVPVAGSSPQQRSRRDVTTRELSSGRPRVYRTHINHRTVVYPAGMRLRDVRRRYVASPRQPLAT